jgi:hypothetical protein
VNWRATRGNGAATTSRTFARATAAAGAAGSANLSAADASRAPTDLPVQPLDAPVTPTHVVAADGVASARGSRGVPRGAVVAVHAASSAVYLAAASAVELFTTLPVLAGSGGALYYPGSAAGAWAWAGLVAVSSISGWALAARERRGAERANFQDYAVQAVLGQLFTMWLSPFWPRSALGPAADAAVGAAVVAVSVAQLTTQASGRHREAIKHGRRAKALVGTDAAADLPGWAASAAYFQPATVGPVMMGLAGAIQLCVPFTWIAGFQAAHPEHAAIAFHFGLITTLAGHAGMLAPTLRDKRRISQRAEAAVCALSSYAAIALLTAFLLRFPWLWQVAGPWSTLFPIQ